MLKLMINHKHGLNPEAYPAKPAYASLAVYSHEMRGVGVGCIVRCGWCLDAAASNIISRGAP